MPYSEKYMQQRIERVISVLKDGVYTEFAPLRVCAYVTKEPVAFSQRESGEYIELFPGDKWGELWDCAWFRFDGDIPSGAVGKSVVAILDVSGEMCIFDSEGTPLRCMTNVGSTFDSALGKPGKRIYPLDSEVSEPFSVSFWADAGCNDLFGRYCNSGKLAQACLAFCDEKLRELYYDFDVLYDFFRCLNTGARRNEVLHALYSAANLIDCSAPSFNREASDILKNILMQKCGDSSLSVTAIGHAHIDLAWLWPLRETRRKGARTFSNAVALMDKYPDYIFGASQPQLYKWIKEDYPGLYEKIKQRVRENRWECQGGMWVEADTNVSGGEPLVRQFLYGKRFFREEFGKDMRCLWLPDVFGYNGALPQIMKKCGVDYFMTQKLSWSEHNRYPHHTFNWKGIDGTEVLVHMLPENTYNGPAMPRSLKAIENNYIDSGVCNEALMLFGIGDGGGGPSTFHLEGLKRIKSLDGLIPCSQGFSIDMLDRIAANREQYKTWFGELYLERHQGTFTTQSRIKRYNRLAEFALRETEFACAWASTVAGAEYPKQQLDVIWEEFLLYQFHDILPGSSINRVYAEAEERFSKLLGELKKLKKEAYGCLSARAVSRGESVAFNSLPFEVTTQLKTTKGFKKITVPAFGFAALSESREPDGECSADTERLSNALLTVCFGKNGEIVRIFDNLSGRDVLVPGARANLLKIYDDCGDAWDMKFDYREQPFDTMQLTESRADTEGENAVLEQTFSYGNSTLTQHISLTQDGVIVFRTNVDWREKRKMLRTDFPVNVLSTGADCEIQFGSIRRSTTENTTWDWAQYEVCAQKWVDKSQRDYGVAVLNNGKYGYRIKDDYIDINLLRSSAYPDVNADYGCHEFTYCLYPHKGDYVAGGVVQKAYELNQPLTVVKNTQGADISRDLLPLFKTTNGTAVVEAVKLAEDGSGVVLRIYESSGGNTEFTVTPNFRFSRASVVNMLEEELTECSVSGGTVSAQLKPFEILTIKIW